MKYVTDKLMITQSKAALISIDFIKLVVSIMKLIFTNYKLYIFKQFLKAICNLELS
jgi:hypothetical protein